MNANGSGWAFANLVGAESAKPEDEPKARTLEPNGCGFLHWPFWSVEPDEVAMELHHPSDQAGDETNSQRGGDPQVHREQAGMKD